MKIYSLDSIDSAGLEKAGGKAKGLYQLFSCGLNVAAGFVIIDIDSEINVQEAADYYEKSGMGRVAVRSSATAEDGADFSSAGQYLTVLGAEGKQQVKKAIKQCLGSLTGETAKSYSSYFSEAKSEKMSVIVQQMIEADVSGVCFTQHDGDDGFVHIEAVVGLGESLVSGQEQANTYIVQKDSKQAQGDELLTAEMVRSIADEAVKASAELGMPLDTEWAVASGELFWLQARPITVTETVDPFELDTQYIDENHVLTTCNIGEMMPGAVTPLTLSTSIYSIEYGFRKMIIVAGGAKDFDDVPQGSCIESIGNNLFINITTCQRISDSVLASDRNGTAIAICGRIIEEAPQLPLPHIGKLRKALNTRKYFSMLMKTNKACKQLNKLAERFWIEQKQTSAEQYEAIDKVKGVLDEAFWLHYIPSAHSGAMNSALFFILLAEGMEPDDINRAIAGVLEDIDGIESVDILRSLRKVAKAMLDENPEAKDYSAEQLAEYLKVCEGDSAYALEHFMKRHGHRAIREAEMRSKSWHMDDVVLCGFLKSIIASGAQEKPREKSYQKNIEGLLSGRKGILKHVVKYLIGQARKGVVNREYTKSKSILVLDKFKESYWHLGRLLEKENVLPDSDLVFFLTHEELGSLIRQANHGLVKKATARRRLLDEQMQLKFEEINIGRPKPKEEEIFEEGADVLLGTSISRGKATGKARVVKSVEDANQLQKGEIMVAAFTDIGWSPYYSMIGALVTEVGSTLSHGAVVAREFALPLVSNIPFATKKIKTGDTISVDGTSGKVAIID